MTGLSDNLTKPVIQFAHMQATASKFPALFRKYRLKAEFSTLSQLGLALAEKGLIYEDSIFSHWQKGDRIPNRTTILKLIEIFIERRAITTLNQVNEFLVSVGYGYISEEELRRIPIKLGNPIFQVPTEIENFTGRENIIKEVVNRKDIFGKTILIHGSAGIGKTALAIKLGHLLKNKFTDGILWYKIEEDNISDILFSIAHIFGEDFSEIKNKQTRATIVRSLLATKNVLIILDSAELNDEIYLLIPNSQFCTTIITSQKNHFKVSINFVDISLKPFTDTEVISLFQEVLKKKFSKTNSSIILESANQFGNLPLAIHIFARQIRHSNISASEIPELLNTEENIFQDLNYENKNLHVAIDMSYKKLDIKMKSVLVSASIFKGKDFSIDSIGYINGLSIVVSRKILQSLVDLSLIEPSAHDRYRIHPEIREFVRGKLDYPRSSYLTLIAIFIFLIFACWWIFLQIFYNNREALLFFSCTYGIIALFGGICGMDVSKKWGGIKTLMGSATLMFASGLCLQAVGQASYTYYLIIAPYQTPYPSFGDIAYFGTIPFYIYGIMLLAKSSGIKLSIQSFKKKLIAIIIPIVMLTIAYYLFLQGYTFNLNNPVKIFLDFGYSLGEAIYISIAIIVFIFSRTILDGIMKSKALWLLIALVVQFLGDYIFLLDVKLKTYYPGNYDDFILLLAYFTMTIALLNLKSIQVKIKNY